MGFGKEFLDSFINTNKSLLGIASGYNLVQGVVDNLTAGGEYSREETDLEYEKTMQTEYLSQPFSVTRADLERTQDKINIISDLKRKKIKEMEQYHELLDSGMEETEIFKKIETEYDNELEKLYQIENVQSALTEYSRNKLSAFNRYISAPMYDVLVDSMNITDFGDLISGGRILTSAAGGAIGSAVGGAVNVTNPIAQRAIGVVAPEMATSALDTVLDIGRLEDQNIDYDISDVARVYTGNVVGGLAVQGTFYGVGKLLKYGVDRFLNGSSQALASSTVAPKAKASGPIAEAAEETLENTGENLTVKKAYSEHLERTVGKTTAKQKIDVDMPSNKIEQLDELATEDVKYNATLKSNVDTIMPRERQIQAQILKNELGDKAEELEFDAKVISQDPTFANLVDNYKFKDTNRKTKDIVKAFVINARNMVTVFEEQSTKDFTVDEMIKKGDLSIKEMVYSITNMFSENRMLKHKTFNLGIEKRGAEIYIKNFADFVKYSRQNGIDLDKALYTGVIGKETPVQYKDVFKYVKDTADKFLYKTKPLVTISSDEKIYDYALANGLEDLFRVADFSIPENDIFTIMINPELPKERLSEIVRSLRDKSKPFLQEKINIDEVYNKSLKVLETIPDKVKDILRDNISEDSAYIKRLLREQGLSKHEAGVVFGIFNKTRKSIVPDEPTELLDLIVKDISQKNARNNRIFQTISKQDILSLEDLFSSRSGSDTFQWVDEKSAREFLKTNDEEGLKQLDQVLEITKKYLGTNDPKLAKDYYGFTIRDKSGRKQLIDIREQDTLDLVDKFLKSIGITGKKFHQLKSDQQIKVLDSLMGELQVADNINIGKNIIRQYGVNNLEQYFKLFIDEAKINPNELDFKVIHNADDFSAFFTPAAKGTGKPSIFLTFPKGESFELKLGVLRHELEHAKEFFNDGLEKMKFDGFSNNPTVAGKEALQRLLEYKPVSVREMLGAYYNNHFYNYQTDTFERNLLSILMRDRIAKMTPYEKAQNLIKMLRASRIGSYTNRVKTKEVFGFLADEIGMPDIIDNNFFQDFLVNSFKSPDKVFDLFNELSKIKVNQADRITNSYWQIIAGMVNDDIGISPAGIVSALNTSRVKQFVANNFDNPDYYNANSYFGKVFGIMRDSVRNAFVEVGSRKTVPDNFLNLAEAFTINYTIGNRLMNEAVVTPNMIAVSSLLSEGDITGLTKIAKHWGTGLKNFGYSGMNVVGNVIENIGVVTNKALGNDLESGIIYNLGDSIKKHFAIKGINFDTYDAKNLTNLTTQLSILANDGDPDKIAGIIARTLNKNLVSNSADDLFAGVIAEHLSVFSLKEMLKKGSYEELSKIQKSMYNVSGFRIEDFNLFKEKLETVAKVSDGFLNINAKEFNIKNMIGIGKSKYDIVGMGRATFKTDPEVSKFYYMIRTVAGATVVATKRMKSINIGGVEVPRFSPKKLATVVGLGTGIVAASLVPQSIVSYTKEHLLGYRNNVEELRQDIMSLDEEGGAEKLALDYFNYTLETTPYSYYKNNNFNSGMPLDNLGYLGSVPYMIKQNIYNYSTGEVRPAERMIALPLSIILGSTSLRLINKYTDEGKATKRKFKSKAFKAELKSEFLKDSKKYLKSSATSYYNKANRQYNAMNIATQY